MLSEFIQTKTFSRLWDKLGFIDDDLRLLELDLLENGEKYPVIQGTGGLRKCRIKGGTKMSKLGDLIKQSLNEAIEDTKKHNLNRNYIYIEPVKEFSANEIKKIRHNVGLTQKLFAGYLGVSIKTIESWEAGTNIPSGAASRILSMLEQDNSLIEKYPFVTI